MLLDGSALNTVVPGSGGAWSLDWTPTSEGTYELSARATDAAKNSTVSGGVSVSVAAPTGSITGTLTHTLSTFGSAYVAAAQDLAPAPVVPGAVFVVFQPGARGRS